MQVTTIGLDLAKHVFQIHGIDAAEKVVVRKQLRRSQVKAFFEALAPCLIGIEACATAHYWARELTKLGHEVRLMPAKDVKAYVKRNKNDAADAEAICEAVTCSERSEEQSKGCCRIDRRRQNGCSPSRSCNHRSRSAGDRWAHLDKFAHLVDRRDGAMVENVASSADSGTWAADETRK
jgi:transposase